MNGTKRILLLAGLVASGWGCSSAPPTYLNTRRPVELARVTTEEGHEEIYRLDLGVNKRDINLVVRTERTEERPDLGLTLREIDKSLAQRKMLDPYRGLFVERVREKGPADIAGVLPGDILLRINGVELRYDDQLEHIVRSKIEIENEVELVLLRGYDNRQEVRIKYLPDRRPVRVPSTRAIPLVSPEENGPDYAGMVLGTLPAEWTARIYGENRPTVLVGGVFVGSPAYHSGIRTGDRIVSVEGRYFEDADLLARRLREWGARGEELEVEVYQKQGGSFRAELDPELYEGSTEIKVPFVFDLETNMNRTEWDVGPLGLVAGYEGDYRRSDTRAGSYERRFSCLLGLFRYHWWPDRSRTRLLWLIKFGSD